MQNIDGTNTIQARLWKGNNNADGVHCSQPTMMFMGKKPLFALIKWRERAYNLSLGVEKPFSSEPFLKASSFPTNCSLVLVEFFQSLDVIT